MIVASTEVTEPGLQLLFDLMISNHDSKKHFFAILTGENRSFLARVVRLGLRLTQPWVYVTIFFRNAYYSIREKLGMNYQAGCPVICVGNLSMGGTGKTPMVVWLAQHLTHTGRRVVIISRGYGANVKNGGNEGNDEAREMSRSLPDVPHLQNPDRIAAVKEAVKQFFPDVILMDDGFQHRRLSRNLNIVLVDATQTPLFTLFPCGVLREPFGGLRRADAVVVTRKNLVDAASFKKMEHKIRLYLKSGAIYLTAEHSPVCFENFLGENKLISAFSERKIGVFCGIGNPQAFLDTLHGLGISPPSPAEKPLSRGVEGQAGSCVRLYDDHYNYSASDITDLEVWAKQGGFDVIVCTWKDLVKVQKTDFAGIPIYALKIEMRVSEPEKLLSLVEETLRR